MPFFAEFQIIASLTKRMPTGSYGTTVAPRLLSVRLHSAALYWERHIAQPEADLYASFRRALKIYLEPYVTKWMSGP